MNMGVDIRKNVVLDIAQARLSAMRREAERVEENATDFQQETFQCRGNVG